jgi:hypothetical protein
MLRILSLKDALRAGIVLSLCLSLFTLSSCSDDDEDPDPDNAPTVSFKNLGNNSTVWNTVSATLEVNDDKGIAKVEVYIDGVLHQTLTTAPYELTWDTRNASESTHAIRVVVTDAAGNESKAEVAVTVRNILLSFDVAADQLESGERGFVVLSDDNGVVIASTEYHNSNHIEMRSTNFSGEKFTVTEILTETYDEYSDADLHTFSQVERGAWTVYDSDNVREEVTANLSFSNGIVGGGHYLFATNASNLQTSDLSYATNIGIFPTSSKLYVARYNVDPSVPDTYGLFSSISAGNNAVINMSQVNQPLSSVSVDFPAGASFLEVFLEAFPVTGNYTDSYRIYSVASETSPLKIEYPGSAFPSYYSETFYRTNDFYFSSGRNSAFYHLTPFQHSGEFSYVNGKLNYSASGNYDFATIAWGVVSEGSESQWTFYVPKGSSQSVAIPDLNTAMSALVPDFAKYIPDFTGSHDGYGFHEYELFDGYDGFKTFIRNSDGGMMDLWDRPVNYTLIEIENDDEGRVGASQGRTRETKRGRRK